MAKNRSTATQALRRVGHEQYVASLRSGVVPRAHTFKNKKKDQARNACRKGNWT